MGLAMAPQSIPAVVAYVFLPPITLTTPITATGSSVNTSPMPIHHSAAGCMTVERKSRPASRPRQARYIDRPSERSMRLALVVV